METVKKVKIELPAIDGTPKDTPIKHKKHKSQPSSSHFVLTPKFAPQISESVKMVSWESTKKRLSLVVKETPHFEVQEWMDHIKKKTAEALKGPFNVDIDNDVIFLDFLNFEGEIVGRMSFKNITLEKHKCNLGYSKCESLKHKIKLQYETAEKISVDHNEFNFLDDPHRNEEADDEWQSVEDA